MDGGWSTSSCVLVYLGSKLRLDLAEIRAGGLRTPPCNFGGFWGHFHKSALLAAYRLSLRSILAGIHTTRNTRDVLNFQLKTRRI